MEQMFAPWRIKWVEKDDMNEHIDGCVLCELPTLDDRENRILARSELAYVVVNISPYNPGHVMVVPRQHESEYTNLTEEDLLDHARLKQRTFDALEDALDPDGFNAGLNLGRGAGGSIGDHLHTHIVPRWEGDTNFMPVISDTKVVVEALDDTYDRLREAFAEQEGVDGSGDGAVRVE